VLSSRMSSCMTLVKCKGKARSPMGPVCPDSADYSGISAYSQAADA
jgi:hypothetical protein